MTNTLHEDEPVQPLGSDLATGPDAETECTAEEVQRIRELLALHREAVAEQLEADMPAWKEALRERVRRRMNAAKWLDDLREADQSEATAALARAIQNLDPLLPRALDTDAAGHADRIKEARAETWAVLWRKRRTWPAGDAGVTELLALAGRLLRRRLGNNDPRPDPVSPA